MSTPRITQRLITAHSLSALQTGLNRLSVTQEQMSTGRTINRPSDNPTGTNDAMRLRASLAAKTQYSRNAEDGTSWLNDADSTLTSMLDEVSRARDLILQGTSDGNNDASSRQALATELTQIRAGLLDQANAQHLGRPLFGGTTAGSAAYDSSGTFVGDTNDVNRTVGDGVTVAVNVTGPQAFAAGGTDLFAVLDSAISKLSSNSSAVSTDLTDLDAVTGSMKTALSTVGSRTNRIDTASNILDSTTLDTKSALSDVENVDIASAIVDLQMQEVAYQASLGATSKVIQPSLMDFLK
jgi:flagellar hook-associated protein 3 FlgL